LIRLSLKDKLKAQRIYLVLAALFISCLVISNLIFQKFFHWDFLGIYTFEISLGILAYPVTFLITDIISKIYVKKKTNQGVTTGVFAYLFSLLIVYIGNMVPATEWSPIDNALFNKVFGATTIAVFAPMAAYVLAQYKGIQLFHFWKKYPKENIYSSGIISLLSYRSL
jgi:uncharacterized integral membrane protein (TIGR00697 family)